MSRAEELRTITKTANERLDIKQEIDYEEFFNGDLFKNILSDFEKDALIAAQRGKYSASIRLNKYFDCDSIQAGDNNMLAHAMKKAGYNYLSESNIDGYTQNFSWYN